MLNGKKIIGLCITKVSNPTSHLMITSLNSCLRDKGYNLFVYTVSTDLYWNTPSEEGKKSVFELIDYDVIDALVIMYELIKDKDLLSELIKKAREKGKPVFVVDGKQEGCININFNYAVGFEKIVRHVIETHAVKRPHFMAGMKGNSFSEERLDIFKKVIAENGIPFDDSMVSYGDFWDRPAMAATEEIVARGDLPEAIICANDTMAVAACAVLKNHCIMVPDDIIVTGFDGIDDVVVVNPTISTYKCSNSVVAEKIADMLLSGDIPADGVDIDIAPIEELGQSCGCIKDLTLNPMEHLTKLNGRFNHYQGEEHHLFNMMAKIFNCGSFEEIADIMGESAFYDASFILRKCCTDSTVDPLTVSERGYEEGAIVLYDTDSGLERFVPYEFDPADIVPDLQKLLDAGDPLIFAPLNFLHIPLGYVCFHFHNYDIDNYYKIVQIINILNNAIGGFRNMMYQQYLNSKLEEVYKLDRMTGMYNRNALVSVFEDMADELIRSGEQFTFVLSDLDRLKYINDTFGHTEGDFAIASVGKALKSVCPDNAFIARWGGDELVALFKGSCDAEAIKQGITTYLEELRAENDKVYEITSSVGVVTTVLHEGEGLDDITKAADKLMYTEKTARKKQRQ